MGKGKPHNTGNGAPSSTNLGITFVL